MALVVLVGTASFGSAAAGAAVLVTGKQVKDHSLLSRDLRNGRAIGGAEVTDGSIQPRTLGALPAGDSGGQGPQGPVGVDGLADVSYQMKTFDVLEDTDFRETATCPQGTRVVGGGASADLVTAFTEESFPLANGSGWRAIILSPQGDTTAYVWAVCAAQQ